jgi:hypothetical protein
MYQPHLVAMVDWVSFCVKPGYFWPKYRLIWVERDLLLRPNLHLCPNGIQVRFRWTVGWRKKGSAVCLRDEPQDVFQMNSGFRGSHAAVVG